MTCGVGCRRGSDPTLLWLWRRQAATALIRPLAWEPPYAAGAALEMAKRQKDQKKKKKKPACIGGCPRVSTWRAMNCHQPPAKSSDQCRPSSYTFRLY